MAKRKVAKRRCHWQQRILYTLNASSELLRCKTIAIQCGATTASKYSAVRQALVTLTRRGVLVRTGMSYSIAKGL